MHAASYFQLLVYSHRVTTAGSSACLLWQIFHGGCSNSDCAQRDGNNRALKLSRTRQGLKGYAGRSELQHRWLCTSSVVKSSEEQWNELRIKIPLFALCICFSIILSCVFLGQQQLWHKVFYSLTMRTCWWIQEKESTRPQWAAAAGGAAQRQHCSDGSCRSLEQSRPLQNLQNSVALPSLNKTLWERRITAAVLTATCFPVVAVGVK